MASPPPKSPRSSAPSAWVAERGDDRALGRDAALAAPHETSGAGPKVELLCTIPGVATRTAEVILAECGADMSRFATAAHLASWAGMCPGNNESAGKHHSGRTRKAPSGYAARWSRPLAQAMPPAPMS